MTLSRRGFFRRTTGAVAGALGLAMTKQEVEAIVEDPRWASQYMNEPKPSDVYANVPSDAIYYQVEAGERVVPGDLLRAGKPDNSGIDTGVHKAIAGDHVVGICISYDDQEKTCVMATTPFGAALQGDK